MGESKLILARIGGSGKTRKPSKSAQNSVLLLQEAPPCRCGKKESLEAVWSSKRRGGLSLAGMGEPKLVLAEFVWLGDFRFFGWGSWEGFSWGWLDWWFHKRFGTA